MCQTSESILLMKNSDDDDSWKNRLSGMKLGETIDFLSQVD